MVVSVALSASLLLNGGGGSIGCFLLAIRPPGVALLLVVEASVPVGQPLTAALKRFGRESAANYIVARAIVGCILPTVIAAMIAHGGYMVGAARRN